MSGFSSFYNSVAWKKCRAAYLKKVGGLCERCLKQGRIQPAEVVHHKVYMNERTIRDPKMALNFDNLEALCWEHHEKEHKGVKHRYIVDHDGHVIPDE